ASSPLRRVAQDAAGLVQMSAPMRIAFALLALAVALADARQPPAQPPPGSRGRGGIQVMTLTSTAWPDGGSVPAKYSQAGGDISPALTWSNVPDTATSFVLVVHDLDAAVNSGTDDRLHWLVWNIPGSARSLPEHVPQGATLPEGSRQISA